MTVTIVAVVVFALVCVGADVVHDGIVTRWRARRRVRVRRGGIGDLDAALSRRVRMQIDRQLAAAHARIAGELDARTPWALRELVGTSALSVSWLNSEHGERTLRVTMSDESELVLGSIAEPPRRELIRMLRDGPAQLVSVWRDAVAFRLQFEDLSGTQCAVWSRVVRVIDDATAGRSGS
ncbi:MAG TPA: hypothetical protein VKB75_01335 [Jatrophihabitans sp.]|nr:hypothetical protein [Jatrophihabitans sp.]